MKFLQELETILKGDERFVSQDGQLLKPRVRDAVSQLDAKLIRSLAASPLLKEHFFKNVDGITIFDQEKFMWVVNSKEFLPDSYTAYRNKIGLSANDRDLISASSEVTLVWPYKDCVLEGGQGKEDERRDEVFYNETLAPDEVGRLLAPKAFCNATRYTAEGEERLTKFDENDNLIIKGNNLLALSSLLERYEGQVKCIYIDPPYNTRNDSFAYNDQFNHSTWLSFMKTRLEFARKLLAPDGLIFVQCDDNEYGYLKVLADSIFERSNFIATLVWHGRGGRQDSRYIAQVHESIICYAKDIDRTVVHKRKVVDTGRYPFSDDKGLYKTQLVRKWGSNSRRQDRPNLYYSVEFEGYTIFPILPNGEEGCWRWGPTKLNKAIANDLVVSKTRDDGVIELYQKIYQSAEDKEVVRLSWMENTYSGDSKRHLDEMFGSTPFDYAKPEGLIAEFIEMSTHEGDLVLDFFLGSGTTAAVAHKMGRRYIGVEQMDYVSSVTVPRLQKVIDGEQGGVSKAQDWQGGGSFVYVELAEQGEKLMSELQNAMATNEVQGVLDRATESGLLRPSVLPDQLETSRSEFEQLPLEEQKKIVAELVDKNRLYVNASEVEDADLGLSAADIAFTKSFYGKGE